MAKKTTTGATSPGRAASVSRVLALTRGEVVKNGLIQCWSAKGKGGPDWLQRFSGSTASVAEYLAQEVLDSRPAKQRDFLLRSSVLGEFCAAMCSPPRNCIKLGVAGRATNSSLPILSTFSFGTPPHSKLSGTGCAQVYRAQRTDREMRI
jgi:hypothetical protein